jgi:hypothetical protein
MCFKQTEELYEHFSRPGVTWLCPSCGKNREDDRLTLQDEAGAVISENEGVIPVNESVTVGSGERGAFGELQAFMKTLIQENQEKLLDNIIGTEQRINRQILDLKAEVLRTVNAQIQECNARIEEVNVATNDMKEEFENRLVSVETGVKSLAEHNETSLLHLNTRLARIESVCADFQEGRNREVDNVVESIDTPVVESRNLGTRTEMHANNGISVFDSERGGKLPVNDDRRKSVSDSNLNGIETQSNYEMLARSVNVFPDGSNSNVKANNLSGKGSCPGYGNTPRKVTFGTRDADSSSDENIYRYRKESTSSVLANKKNRALGKLHNSLKLSELVLLPKFNGDLKSQNVKKYLAELKDLLALLGIDEEHRLKVVKYCLVGTAKNWLISQFPKWSTFSDFEQAFLNHYTSPRVIQAQLNALRTRKYRVGAKETLEEFALKQYSSYCNLIENPNEGEILDLIIQQLPSTESKMISLQRPRSMDQLLSYLQDLDHTDLLAKDGMTFGAEFRGNRPIVRDQMDFRRAGNNSSPMQVRQVAAVEDILEDDDETLVKRPHGNFYEEEAYRNFNRGNDKFYYGRGQAGRFYSNRRGDANNYFRATRGNYTNSSGNNGNCMEEPNYETYYRNAQHDNEPRGRGYNGRYVQRRGTRGTNFRDFGCSNDGNFSRSGSNAISGDSGTSGNNESDVHVERFESENFNRGRGRPFSSHH